MGEEFQMLSIYIVNVWEVRKHDVYVHVCVHACAHVHVRSSTHSHGCVANGPVAMAAFRVLV